MDRKRRFYVTRLAVYVEFGPPDDPGLVFCSGQGCSRSPGTRPARSGAW
jgi:hypothetical protein